MLTRWSKMGQICLGGLDLLNIHREINIPIQDIVLLQFAKIKKYT